MCACENTGSGIQFNSELVIHSFEVARCDLSIQLALSHLISKEAPGGVLTDLILQSSS